MNSEKVPDEFKKIINDLILDLESTIPEIMHDVEKWWKPVSFFDYIDNKDDQEIAYLKAREQSVKFVFQFCKGKYPKYFFEILYQDESIFQPDSGAETEFLPQVDFKELWKLDITSKTKEIIWKYLQLILFCIVGSVDKRDAFGDCSKVFESMNSTDLKSKLEETISSIQNVFDKSGEESNDSKKKSNINVENIPGVEGIHEHVTGMLDGKLGKLAKEIAEETASNLKFDMDNVTNMQDVFGKMMQNPSQLMDLVKNVGGKLDSRIKSGDINENELMTEAASLLGKMKDMPGMENIQTLLKQMGMPNVPSMNTRGNNSTSNSTNDPKYKKPECVIGKPQASSASVPSMTDEELVEIFDCNSQQTKRSKNKKKKKASQICP
tara:strand:+ start:218 stop:1357 length:1140 start_codon:yes stop_codon:yes gene_type:complete